MNVNTPAKIRFLRVVVVYLQSLNELLAELGKSAMLTCIEHDGILQKHPVKYLEAKNMFVIDRSRFEHCFKQFMSRDLEVELQKI